ncbi:MAG: ABC transporter permease subunit [Streptococcaceae bacterium]|nr:ABC transporter permease subunit [Streptococcaceae bacterium]
MVWPGIIFLIIFAYIPMYGISIAFQNYSVTSAFGGQTLWVGLDNFTYIISDINFWQSMVNTLAISLLKLAIEFPLAIILALMVYQLKEGKFANIIKNISYLPHFISWIVLGGMITAWLGSGGLFNQLLGLIAIHTNANWLLNPNAYWMIAALSDTWKEVGWGTILYLAAMSSIDPTLYEAATIDGANRFRKIWSITIPGIRYMIVLQLILWVSGIVGSNLDQTMILLNPTNRPTANVVNYYLFQVGIQNGNFSYATAVGLGLSIVSVILMLGTYFATKKLNDGVSVL